MAASAVDLLPFSVPQPTKISASPRSFTPPRLQNPQWTRCRPPPLRVRPPAAISGRITDGGGIFDPELRSVLELATDEELYELESILFGPSYFSPLLKSIMNKPDVGCEIREDYEAREDFIEHLESRFLFLAADARSTLRGWRPSYRNVLLGVRRKLGVPCSSKLSTEDLEAEIYLHLLHEYSSQEIHSSSWDEIKFLNSHGNLELGVNHWKGHSLAALKVGAEEVVAYCLWQRFINWWLARRLSGKMFLEAANYQIRHELLKKGGQLAAINLESRTALLVARQGLARAASRYFGLRSLMTLVGPVLWGMLLADIVIQMMGTDYARILQAITAFAQIRLTRTYGWTSNKD
ncbi:hypothetical protein QJS10_CPA06g02244 [Acorus calamus]|uniref:Uncharacterized protein n=1 Tax=Acorus calamus TaxID=4465 RepID=A0AAV9ELY9_ACOCL|nr:hypothetical protein QJS10_CPA06g02244 [Acorus calamus]